MTVKEAVQSQTRQLLKNFFLSPDSFFPFTTIIQVEHYMAGRRHKQHARHILFFPEIKQPYGGFLLCNSANGQDFLYISSCRIWRF